MRKTLLVCTLIAFSFAAWAKKHPVKPESPTDAAKRTDVAKIPDSKRWKSGFIVTLKGDTVQGKIKSMDFLDVYYDYQKVVSFRDDKGENHYSPNDLRSFSFSENSSETVTLQSVSSPEGTGKAFMRLYYNGPCKVYGMTVVEVNAAAGAADGQAQTSLIPREKKYLQIKNSQFYPIRRAGFRKNMREVFASYPRIVAGLDSKQYTYDKWETLVKDYNDQYK